MRRFNCVLRPVCFLAVLTLLLGGVSWLFVPKDNTAEAGIQDRLTSGYLAEPIDSLDVLVLGDSVPKFAVIPPLLWHETGIASYVCATAGDALPKLVETTQAFFRRQSPKVVLLETNVLFRYIKPGYGEELQTERIFPVLRYHDNWKFVRPRQMLRRANYTWVSWEKGHYLCKLIEPCTPGNYMERTEEDVHISKEAMDWLLKIQELCDQKGSQLILCSMPNTKNMNSSRYRLLEDLAGTMNVPYVDMNQDRKPGIDWTVDSVDAGDHLNFWGAKKLTRTLGTCLVRTGLLPDHREEEAYRNWDDCYKNFMDMAKKAHGNRDFDPDDI